MVWTVGQTVSSKAATVLQQIIIAKYFLSDDDFGMVAMAQVVVSLASIGASLGVGEILVRRHQRFDIWVQIGFWLNVCAGLTGMLLVFGLVPVWNGAFATVAHLFGRHDATIPQVQGLLLIWALYLPSDAILQVIYARLRVDMRFKALAVIGTFYIVAQAVLAVSFAACGWGPYALVAPVPVVSIATVLIAWRLCGMRIGLRPKFRRWGFILKDSRYFLMNNVLNTFLQQGDYMVTGVFFAPAILGAYYWSYRMSTQTAQLIGANLTGVLLPSFAKMKDELPRMIAAYKRTCAALLLIGMPICFLQSLLAQPVFHLIFGDRLARELPLFELLSLGMAFTLPMTASTSLLLAQGRYRLNMFWTGTMAVTFVATVLAAAFCGSVIYVAGFVGGYFAIWGPLTVLLPLKGMGVSKLRFFGDVYVLPVLLAVVSAACGLGLSRVGSHGDLMQAVLRLGGWGLSLAVMMALFRPKAAMEVLPRLMKRAPRIA
ncbi:MAG TPA: oligosaccharide flippase family protein [Phycisphaerae bacterium]|nr:oligosaccharide flippase family protein [Phycisphaerae bacterium]